MEIWNYCPNCGKRLHPTESFCEKCGTKTTFDENSEDFVFNPPISSIGFFDLKIDFSSYIDSHSDCNYETCSCGYLNETENEYCYYCGVKRFKNSILSFIGSYDKPRLNFDDISTDGSIICECGAINSSNSEFCDMCGCKLDNNQNQNDNFSNFNFEFDKSIFCFCGDENDYYSQFCKNCGLPLSDYGKQKDIKILCACSALNDVTSQYCVGCGANLNKEKFELICVCGNRSPINAGHCSSCNRPLNPERYIKTRIVCDCGKIVDFNSEFCPSCGKNIKKSIKHKKQLSSAINSLISRFR